MDHCHRICFIVSIVLWFVAFPRTTGGGSVTWFEPPPVEIITDPTATPSAFNRNLTKGFEEKLSWNFSLSVDLTLLIVTVAFKGSAPGSSFADVASYAQSVGSASVQIGFKDRFNVSWIPSKITLTVFNVTTENNGEFECRLFLFDVSGTDTWRRKLQVTVLVPPNIAKITESQTVNEGETITLSCKSDGTPDPTISWTRLSDDYVVTKSVWTLTNISRQENGTYRCTADNGVGSPAIKDVIITVYFPPNITDISKNPTVDEGDIVALNCTANGNPAPNITWTRVSDNRSVNRLLKISGKEDEGFYRCTADNGIGIADRSEVFIYVQNYRPTDTNLTTNLTNNTVVLNDPFNLMCKADANPPAHYRLYKEQQLLTTIKDNQAVGTFTTSIGERIKQVTYSCTPNNCFGVGPSDTASVIVHFSPSATSNGRNETVLLGTPVTFTCPVDGNPPPSVRWYKGSEPSGTVLSSEKEFEFTSNSLNDTGLYTCFAYNYLGNISVSFGLKVVELISPATPSPTTPREMTVVQLTLTITNKDCSNFLEKEFRVEVQKTLGHLGLKDIEIETRCGSVIVDLGLGFNQSVDVNDVISTLKDAASDGKFGDFNVDSNSIRQTPVISTSSRSPTNTEGTQGCNCSCNTVLWVIIGILVAIIIVLIIIIIWQNKKGTTKRPYEIPPNDAGFYDNGIAMEDISPTHVSPSSSTQKLSMSGPGYMDLQEVTRSDKYRTDQSKPTTSQQQNPSQPAEYAPLNLRTRSWEVARDSVTVDKIIGKGAFGQVAKGTAIQLPFSNGKTTVAVKMLKSNAPEADKKDLLSELELMKTLKPHPHIIKLMGCVTLSEPLLVLIEYVPYGDLLGYLRKSRGLNDTYYKDPDVKPQTSLTSQQLMKFAWQTADGMSYLSSRKIIHRDLAARNVLVGERETCKVTDFGMARDVQQEDIYEKKTRGRLPVKWTAYESLLYGTYTTKSDVWSYGVVLYEIFTIGGSPYPRMDGKRIANALQHGYRMPKPQHVDDALYQIMMNCWQNEPEARPSFTALTKQLKEMEKQHKRLINMHIYDNELYGNLEDLNV